MKKFITTLLVVVVIIAIIVIWKTDKMEVQDNENVVEETGGASGQFAKLANDAIVVMDQRPGDVVIASVVSLSKDGFVVIKKDEEGKAGGIIGVSEFLTVGAHSKIDIGTTESLMDGLTYYAELFEDNGDGVFDPKKDGHVRWNGDDIYTIFNIDKNAADPGSVEINY